MRDAPIVLLVVIIIVGGFVISEWRRNRRMKQVSESWDRANQSIHKPHA